MNITDLRTGDRRAAERRSENKSEDTPSAAEDKQPDVEMRSGNDRRLEERRDSISTDGAGESFVRVPVNPEIKSLLLDMYADDQDQS